MPILIILGPPAFGATVAGVLVGVARKLAVERQAPATDFVVLFSIASVAAIALAAFLTGAARVRRGAHSPFPRLWRSVPWTAAGGFALGLVAAGTHALLK